MSAHDDSCPCDACSARYRARQEQLAAWREQGGPPEYRAEQLRRAAGRATTSRTALRTFTARPTDAWVEQDAHGGWYADGPAIWATQPDGATPGGPIRGTREEAERDLPDAKGAP